MWCSKRIAGLLSIIAAAVVATATMVHGETQVVPSIMLSEMYDSNVLLVPSSVVPARRVDDLVTMLSPQVSVLHNGRLVSGTVQAGLSGARYVNNPGLSYVGVNTGLNLNLSEAVKRIIPNATLLVSDSFTFTPVLPSFIFPNDEGNVEGVNLRGIQPARAMAYSNNATATGSYAITPRVSLTTSYMHSLVIFGTQFSAPSVGGFFNTTMQMITEGAQVNISPTDSLNVNYMYSLVDFKGGATFGGNSSFTSQGGTIGWSHTLTPSLKTNLVAGATVVSPGTPSQAMAYTGIATLTGTHQTATWFLSYNRAVSPSFFIAAVPIVNDMVMASVSHPITARLSGSGTASYAHGNSIESGGGRLSFDSYQASLGLQYKITRTVTANTTYSHSLFFSELAGARSEFDRNQVMFTISGTLPYRVN